MSRWMSMSSVLATSTCNSGFISIVPYSSHLKRMRMTIRMPLVMVTTLNESRAMSYGDIHSKHTPHMNGPTNPPSQRLGLEILERLCIGIQLAHLLKKPGTCHHFACHRRYDANDNCCTSKRRKRKPFSATSISNSASDIRFYEPAATSFI